MTATCKNWTAIFFQDYRYKCPVKNIIKVIILSLCYKRFWLSAVYTNHDLSLFLKYNNIVFLENLYHEWQMWSMCTAWSIFVAVDWPVLAGDVEYILTRCSLCFSLVVKIISLNVNKWLVCGNFGYMYVIRTMPS